MSKEQQDVPPHRETVLLKSHADNNLTEAVWLEILDISEGCYRLFYLRTT